MEYKRLDDVLGDLKSDAITNRKELYSVSTSNSREYSSEGDRDCILDLWPCIVTVCPCTGDDSDDGDCENDCVCNQNYTCID